MEEIRPNSLINGDCLTEMQRIPDKSIDMVLCDLPYGVLNKSNPGAKWDNVIPFEPLWKQYKRVIKDHGAIVLFASGMFTAKLMMSQPKLWRYNLVWNKVAPVGFLNANRMPLRVHEDICVFYKKLPKYNPQMKHCEPHQRNHGRGKNNKQTNKCYGSFVSLPAVISDEKFPTSIITFSKANPNERHLHPALKPVDLIRYLIRTYTDVGGVVLDNTMGSGSTCVAAVLEHRRYIGIEKNDHFFEIAKKKNKRSRKEFNFTAMKDYSEYIGNKIGKLTILELAEDYVSPKGVHQPRAICRCDCGRIKTINLLNIINGKSLSCGCMQGDNQRRKALTNPYSPKYNKRLYSIYDGIKSRCYNNSSVNYDRYGAKGIEMDVVWLGVNGRRNFMDWALHNGYRDDFTIDRIDGTKGYTPSNCRWVDVYVQANNKSNNRHLTIDGVTHTVAEWGRISGIGEDNILARIDHYGYSPKEAVFSPLYKIKNRRNSKTHYDIAVKRVREVERQPTLF